MKQLRSRHWTQILCLYFQSHMKRFPLPKSRCLNQPEKVLLSKEWFKCQTSRPFPRIAKVLKEITRLLWLAEFLHLTYLAFKVSFLLPQSKSLLQPKEIVDGSFQELYSRESLRWFRDKWEERLFKSPEQLERGRIGPRACILQRLKFGQEKN